MNKEINKIYLDLDGVVASFDTRFKELYKMSGEQAAQLGIFKEFFDDFIESKHFESLDALPDTRKLINYLEELSVEVEILSSTGYLDVFNEVAKQKKAWLRNNNINFKSTFVSSKEYKRLYANSTTLLIDDTKSNVREFIEDGAKAILHTNVNLTLNQLALIM